MADLKYIIKRVFSMDASTAKRRINEAASASGRSKLSIFFDMIWCGLKYEAGPSDYSLCEFYLLTPKQRATYVTRGVNNRLVKKYNDKDYIHIFENKTEFAERFSKYMGRGWLDMSKAGLSDFKRLAENCEVIFAKPLDGTCGVGIERLKIADYPSLEALWDYLKTKDFGIVEQAVVQHSELNRIYSGAINTVRMVTLSGDAGSDLIFAGLRMGNGGFVDNINNGGMAAFVDIDTGKLIKPATDKEYRLYERHPSSGTVIRGFQIPMWDECVKLVLDAAKVVPQVGYVGWDVCVTEKGPILIEGNSFPGHDIYQMPNVMAPEYMGLKPRVEKYL